MNRAEPASASAATASASSPAPAPPSEKWVQTTASQPCAAAIARTVRGVRSVIDLVRVPPRDDLTADELAAATKRFEEKVAAEHAQPAISDPNAAARGPLGDDRSDAGSADRRGGRRCREQGEGEEHEPGPGGCTEAAEPAAP